MAPSSQPANPNADKYQSEIAFRTGLQEISNKIHAASNLDEILIDLKDEIISLFNAQRLTVYVIDGVKRELVSRFKSGQEISEIRIPVSAKSVAGYAAYYQRLVNIKDVYNEDELKALDANLSFDGSWDQKTGFHTRQVLAFPIVFQKYLLGAIQLINHKDDSPFTTEDEQAVQELA
ncbi:MAG: GAF domain-containing protein, partial [Desulfosarcinaceae bacterium]